MYYFCTYFDHRYLPRGLALYQSLERYCSAFKLWVLCLSDRCYELLMDLNLPHLQAIALTALEAENPALVTVKPTRSPVEYYFTCTPCLPLFVLKHHPEVDLITYLDADLFFFADPAPLYTEMGSHSIALIEHRFPETLRHLEQFGRFNVGWLSFRRDRSGLDCLQWWRDRCLEWCYDRLEADKFADQKYLDHWPTQFPGVVVLQHKGANLATWNLANYRIHRQDRTLWVDDHPLIFFHFHRFKQINAFVYDPQWQAHYQPTTMVRQQIYGLYIQTLAQLHRTLGATRGEGAELLSSLRVKTVLPPQPLPFPRNLLRSLFHLWDLYQAVFVRGEAILVVGSLVF
ncbi:hypothetical protein [Neosynechococcus sphagnicola]|uniref:hypothetical protein n=1 Tax=Neosynechococcus sphagnicola TaxID=1501145 RepID=UPI0006895616|nr:hypothetical protein [Neosynechococcus sphagnicola]